MTKEETIKILALLSAFYAGGKNEPQEQASAWHLIIGKYDYSVAKQAVLNYAENDVRTYASFPAVGVIIAEIKKIQAELDRPIKEVIQGVMLGRDYYLLSKDAMALIDESQYNEWLKINAEVFVNEADKYADILRRRRDYGASPSAGNLVSGVMKRLSDGQDQ